MPAVIIPKTSTLKVLGCANSGVTETIQLTQCPKRATTGLESARAEGNQFKKVETAIVKFFVPDEKKFRKSFPAITYPKSLMVCV